MAEETQDQSQKTEDPTQKRIEDARKKGQVAASREVIHWFMILAATVAMMMVAPGLMEQLRGLFVKFIFLAAAVGRGSGAGRGGRRLTRAGKSRRWAAVVGRIGREVVVGVRDAQRVQRKGQSAKHSCGEH